MTASDWSLELARLRSTKPRPLAKLYGDRGPTPEQATEHAGKVREWNAAYRRASKAEKSAREASNAAWRAASEEERAEMPRQRTARATEPTAEIEDGLERC